MHSSQLPRALRSFHLPCSEGSYIAGCLKITGLGRYLLPPSPVQTVVRTLPHGLFREKIQWVRSFGGKFFLESTYQRSEAQHQSLGSTGGLDKEQVLHDVESAWPLDFHLSFEMPSAPRNIKVSSELSQHVRISHERTMLLGMLPFPKWLVSISIELDVHEEDGNEKKDGGQGGEPPRSSSESSDRTSGSGDGGWYLRCNVDSLGGRLRLIGYEGLLTILPLPEKNKSDSKPPARYVKGFHGVVLFDGHCNLCNASVDFLMRQDAQRQRLLFAPQQSPAANELLKAYGHDSGPAPSLLPQRRADNGDQGTFPGKKSKEGQPRGGGGGRRRFGSLFRSGRAPARALSSRTPHRRVSWLSVVGTFIRWPRRAQMGSRGSGSARCLVRRGWQEARAMVRLQGNVQDTHRSRAQAVLMI
mmetsp:Transcript_65332/g.128262  ORF Transcript_65332/g.128262 Transcript_65332/m.128262 type:complete len:415 (-) Transcript_65332:145-1389(-)